MDSGVQGTTADPLLEPPIASVSETQEDRNEYLEISYNHGRRTIRDIPFLLLFSLLVVCTFGFGIFASVNTNPHRFQISSYVYNASSSACIFHPDSPVLHRNPRPICSIAENLHFSKLPSNYFQLFTASKWGFWEISAFTLVLTLILSLPFLLLLLFFLKRYAKQIVYASLPLFLILPIFINVYWFVACTVSSRCSGALPLSYRIVVLIFVFLLVIVVAWIFIANWNRIELTVDVIGIASNALSRNLGLFGVLPGLTLGLLVYYVPVVLFLIFASRNGEIVPVKSRGKGEFYECVWKEDRWVPAYYALAILTMLWSATAMFEAQIYVISGTIAQWYFSTEDSRPKHGMRASLRNAFGPSFGTICFSGLLIGAVRVVRFVVDNGRQDDGSGCVNLILRFCADALLSAVDFLNKFTINFAAITGEAYCRASGMTYELLKRNLLSAVLVETISTRLLCGIILIFSAAYAIVVCAILKGAMRVGDEAYVVAIMAWCLLMVVLAFLVHVLENVIDTVYVCYAMDRDKGEVNKQDAHEVYDRLPVSRSRRRAGFGVTSAFVS